MLGRAHISMLPFQASTPWTFKGRTIIYLRGDLWLIFIGGLKLLQIAQLHSPLKKYWLVPNVKASGKDSFECNIEQCLLNLCIFFNTDLCDKQGVNGYPTIKYYKYGSFVVEYDGDRTEEDFLAFMKAPPNPLPPDQPDSKPHDTRDEL